MSKNIDPLQKAKNYAFLLLKFRLRSESELCQRLKRKGFADEVIKKILSFLKDKCLIDDNYFAKAWIESRIKKPLGLRRLKQELRIKGINKDIIEKTIGEIKENYNEEEVVKGIIKKRLVKLKNIDPQKARARIYAYLLRRGFSPAIVIDALS